MVDELGEGSGNAPTLAEVMQKIIDELPEGTGILLFVGDPTGMNYHVANMTADALWAISQRAQHMGDAEFVQEQVRMQQANQSPASKIAKARVLPDHLPPRRN